MNANPITVAEKECKKCKTVKLHTAFSRHRSNKDGLQYWCKQCMKEHLLKAREEEEGRRSAA